MLRPRVIPCLLIRNSGLTKTVQFSGGKYVGDPLNAVKIFNEKRVDELVVLDIDATTQNRPPDLGLIEKMAAECRMPLCYGGGVNNVDKAKQIIGLGVEKVALSSALVEKPDLATEIAGELGAQSVVAVLDVKKRRFGSGYRVWTHNGRRNSGECPIELTQRLQDLGIGEIVINSIANDGVMQGYDLSILRRIRDIATVPMTILGGAGELRHLRDALAELGIIGVAAGSLFVFKGKYKAVLINYPSSEELQALHENRH